MRTLLLHDILPDGPVAEALAAAGHDIVRCDPTGSRPFPCVGLSGRCPLDGTVDVAVVIHDHPNTEIAPGEVGAICALRDGVPLVIAGNGAHSPLREVATTIAAGVEDVVGACERAVEARQQKLGRMVGGRVTVDRGKVQVDLPAWSSTADVVRAHQVLTGVLPGAVSIDVGTGSPPMAEGAAAQGC
jgi:hypothetical protein